MTNKEKIIKQIEKNIKQLESDPKEADTIKALRKQIRSMRHCKYGSKESCKPCGGKIVIKCSNPEVTKQTVSPGYCKNCKDFEPLNLKT